MNKTSSIIAAGLIGLMVGCKSKPAEKPKPLEFVNVPINVAASQIPVNSKEKYVNSQRLQSYAVGRYIDPNNGRVMHEAHTIYKETQQPTWNLTPQPDANPVAFTHKQQYKTAVSPLLGQMENILNKLKIEEEKGKDLNRAISQNSAIIQQVLQGIGEIKKQNKVIAQHTKLLKAMIKENQRQIDFLKDVREAVNPDLDLNTSNN